MSNRVFGLVWCLILGAMSVLPLLRGQPAHLPSAVAAVLFGTAALAVPGLLTLPNRLWTFLGRKIHALMSSVILFLIYFLIFAPGALLLRLCGRRRVSLHFDPDAETYWTERAPEEINFRNPY